MHKSNGEYVLDAQGGKLCLTSPAGAKTGTQLVGASCANTKSQHWTVP